MASVKRFRNSRIWYACYRSPDGKRRQRSTGTEDRDEALAIAIAYERTAKAAVRREFTQAAATRFLAEIAAITGTALPHSEPVKDMLTRWLAARRGSLAKRSFETYEQAVRELIAHLGPAAAGPMSEITPAIMARFRDAQTARGRGPATVNKMLTVLSVAFREAVALGAMTRNPCDGITVKGEERARQRRSAFTFAQFSGMVAAAEGDWKTLLLVAGYTGARRMEAAQLTWEQIDLQAGRISLNRTKTGDVHWLPLHPALAEHLKGLTGDRAGAVMPSIAGRAGRDISNIFRRRILPLIGIRQAWGNREGLGRQLAPYSLHSLRHSLATWLAEAGVEERMRMLLIGHEDKQVSRGYTHSQFAELAGALAKVGPVKS